jgi:GTP-binding protein HflX
LTHSNVVAERRLFATLDPSSRRLRFPRDLEVIITDTVGFIRDLPKDLMIAFRATLEELENADLLLHVIDISNPRYEEQINSVEKILGDLNLQKTSMIRVLNKVDLIDPQTSSRLGRQLRGTAISAQSRPTLRPLVEKMEAMIKKSASGP